MDEPAPSTESVLGEVIGEPKPPPTPQEIAEGRVGNGMWQPAGFADEDYRRAVAERTRQHKIELKAARQEMFLEAAREMLPEVTKLRKLSMKIGEQIADKLVDGDEVSQAEVQLFKKALDEANRAEERVLGKATAKVESTTKHDFFAAILNVQKEVRG